MQWGRGTGVYDWISEMVATLSMGERLKGVERDRRDDAWLVNC